MTELKSEPPNSHRDTAIVANEIRSPLFTAEYGLPEDCSHLFLLQAGSGEADTRFGGIAFEAPRLLWFPIGAASRVRLQAGSRGETVALSQIGFVHALPATVFSDRLRSLLRHHLSLPLEDAEQRQTFGDHLSRARRELFERRPGAQLIVNNLMATIFVLAWRLAQADAMTAQAAPRNILERFVLLVSLHNRKQWSVHDYAREIGVSRDRLGNAVRRATGLSPQAYAHRQLQREAKDLLRNSNLQVAEIAFRLGFADPAYFNRFFTRLEGITPGRYRKRARVETKSEKTSFAAWP